MSADNLEQAAVLHACLPVSPTDPDGRMPGVLRLECISRRRSAAVPQHRAYPCSIIPASTRSSMPAGSPCLPGVLAPVCLALSTRPPMTRDVVCTFTGLFTGESCVPVVCASARYRRAPCSRCSQRRQRHAAAAVRRIIVQPTRGCAHASRHALAAAAAAASVTCRKETDRTSAASRPTAECRDVDLSGTGGGGELTPVCVVETPAL